MGSESSYVEINRTTHNAVASSYDLSHREIFNSVEQGRLRRVLEVAAKAIIHDGSGPLVALDYGAGTGNVTMPLLGTGFRVLAADISEHCLAVLRRKASGVGELQTVIIDKPIESMFKREQFDLLVGYSVLHHIPDYLGAVRELAKLVRVGGVLLIDHEVAPSYWNPSAAYIRYRRLLSGRSALIWSIRRLVSIALDIIIPSRIGRRRLKILHAEGDIHVHGDDHIEWDKIKEELRADYDVVMEEEYLLCRGGAQEAYLWNQYKQSCVDMRVLIARRMN
jgi:SAM-dependent methyltransferase